MYAGKSGSVPLPTVGHLQTLKNGYIYWEDGGKWDNERKQTIEGKMFVAFVALIVVEAYRYHIRPVLDAISSTTTRSTIGELNKYQIQQKRDGSWMPMNAMTKKQRQILKCLDLPEAKVKTLVSKLQV
ncbi:MAG: hypothetical protein IJI65_04985 [Lachnospiraceae bacterium]|nr:hypothetical protein [Lachnospiraceae bacterium]